MSAKPVYVSITGLRLNRPWHAAAFFWHAIRSFRQARRAAGNLRAETGTINGVHHTLTVWESEAAMRDFIRSGAHRQAMRAFRTIASGKTFGFEATEIPDWNAVHRLWAERGREY